MKICVWLVSLLFPATALGAQGEVRLIGTAGTRMNSSAAGYHAAVFSEKAGVGYSYRDWLELASVVSYTGLYLMPISLERDANIKKMVTANADLFELVVGANVRLGMTSIISLGIGVGPQLGIYRPRSAIFSDNVSTPLRSTKTKTSFVLLGQLSLGAERRFGEHWSFGVRGVADHALWAPSWQTRRWSGSVEALATYAFFPTT